MIQMCRVIISGGGTGGHIFPALAIANQIKEQCPQAEILFVGAQGKMEMEKVPAAGYPIIGLPIAGLQRKAVLQNITLPFKLWKSVRHARKIITDFQPNVAVGVGGYASWPLLWMAARKGIPCIIQEQNSYPGMANKWLAKKAKIICTAYSGMERFFPRDKIRLTGNPVRSTIAPTTDALKEEGRRFFGIALGRKCILVAGGSLGARTLNNSITTYLAQSKGDAPIDIIWQCGARYREESEAVVAVHPYPWIHLHPFINRMDLALAAADVVISRAGAGAIAELCIAKKAVIFVPSPNVTEDHQTHNAMALVNQKAALIVPEDQVSARLMNVAIDLVHNNEKKTLLEQNMATLARPDAAKEIVNEILKWI